MTPFFIKIENFYEFHVLEKPKSVIFQYILYFSTKHVVLFAAHAHFVI